MPRNISPDFLPPRSPELNPVENVWQYMRQNWLSNSVFETYEDTVEACCVAWNKLTEKPWKIMSIELHDWVIEGSSIGRLV
ncbi:hypothetical protein JCM17960_02910 [Magnetospira thiophila]